MATTQIRSGQVKDDTLVNADINSAAAVATSKLADGAEFVKRGGTVPFTADQSMGSHKLTNVTDPASAQDAATKAYVDAVAQGLSVKLTCRAATATAGTLATSFENLDVIDGVTLATGDRILIKNQAAAADNGIYIVAASGAPTRATDANTAAEVNAGAFVVVEEGTANAATAWIQTATIATLGTDPQTWTKLTAAADVDTLVVRETPSGTINGSNPTFTLANTPTAGTEQIFVNGILQDAGAGNDYQISGATITFETGNEPLSGDKLRATYYY